MALIASCRLVRGYRTDSICDSVPASFMSTGFSFAKRPGFVGSVFLIISTSVTKRVCSCCLISLTGLTVLCLRLIGTGDVTCSACSSYALYSFRGVSAGLLTVSLTGVSSGLLLAVVRLRPMFPAVVGG